MLNVKIVAAMAKNAATKSEAFISSPFWKAYKRPGAAWKAYKRPGAAKSRISSPCQALAYLRNGHRYPLKQAYRP